MPLVIEAVANLDALVLGPHEALMVIGNSNEERQIILTGLHVVRGALHRGCRSDRDILEPRDHIAEGTG